MQFFKSTFILKEYDCKSIMCMRHSETTKHFLLECPRFSQARTAMTDTLSPFCNPSLYVLLHEDDRLDFRQNKLIFLTVQQYISESKRFTSN